MDLKSILELIPEQSDIHLICGGCKLEGTCESMNCCLSDELMRYKVVNIEGRSDSVWVWIEG